MGWKQIRSGIGVRVSDDFAKLQKGVAYEVLFSGQKRRQHPSRQRVYIPVFLYTTFSFCLYTSTSRPAFSRFPTLEIGGSPSRFNSTFHCYVYISEVFVIPISLTLRLQSTFR